MMNRITVTKGYWRKIGNAGESGTAWIASADGFTPRLVFSHSKNETFLGGDNIPYASGVTLDEDIGLSWKTNKVTPVLEAEDGDDIWYVTVRNGDTCDVIADFSS